MDKKRSVLIVDDDKNILDVLKLWFAEEGYACEAVTDAQEALAIIEKDTFDVVFTDIVLPGIDGLELTKKIKELKPGTKVVVMTGFSGDFSYDKAMEAGHLILLKSRLLCRSLWEEWQF